MLRSSLLCAVLLGLVILLAGCAQQVAPSGGAKDTEPPQLVNAYPPDKTTNFDEETIELEFHEFIQLGNTRQEIFVSPPLDESLDVVERRRTVRVKVLDSLKANTTYSIYFNNAVQDLTEGNPAEGLKYVFSTGPDLDSLVVTGNVVHANDLGPAEGVSVGLYKDFADSAILQQKPFYLAETNEEGAYRFENVKAGDYQLFALNDENQNLMLDGGEALAFQADTLQVDSDTVQARRLLLYDQYMEPVQVVNSRMEKPGKLMAEFNRKVDTVTFSIPGVRRKKADAYTKIAANREKAFFWFTPVSRDSLTVMARINQNKIDTIAFKRSEDFFQNPADTAFEIAFARDTFFSKSPFYLKFPDPVTIVGNDCITLHKNDSTEKALDGLEFDLSGAASTKGQVRFPLKPDSSYYLRVGAGCVRDMFGKRNKAFEKQIRVKKESSLGFLELTVNRETWNEPVLLQLLDKEGNVSREKVVRENRKLAFEHLFPGEFRLRAVLDQNGNGRWDGGDWFTKRHPEPVYYYEDPLTIKANWEVREINFQVPVD